jgi:hypothetical protein
MNLNELLDNYGQLINLIIVICEDFVNDNND